MFKQKKFETEIIYDFKIDHINYSFKNDSMSKTYKVFYGDISDDISTIEIKNDWWRNVGVLWTLIGLFQVYQMMVNKSFFFPLWLLLGIGCLVYFFLKKTKYSVVTTNSVDLLIMKNKDHDSIITMIEKKKKSYIQDVYADQKNT